MFDESSLNEFSRQNGFSLGVINVGIINLKFVEQYIMELFVECIHYIYGLLLIKL